MVDELELCCDQAVDELFDEMWGISEAIHAHPELGFKEVFASRMLRSELSDHGFELSCFWDELPTAFVMSFTRGQGARIGICAEYDALPELGHACGHNLIAASAVLAAVAAKRAMERGGIRGRIDVFGTPAEEDGGGKIEMLRRGAFDGVDAALLMHPTSAMTRIGGECTSFTGCYLTFKGVPAHAESHPEQGVNAMDAATLFHMALGVTRQQLPDDVHVSDVVLSMSDDIGQIPSKARLEVEVSSPRGVHVASAFKVVKRIAEGVAMATGCSWSCEDIPGYLGRVPNAVLGDVVRAELIALGEPVMEGMPADKGGEDFGDVSRVVPGCNLFGTILPERKISGHTAEFREFALSDNAKHCLCVTSKAMARAVIKLMRHPELVDRAKVELAERLAREV